MNVLIALAATGILSLFSGVLNMKKLVLPVIIFGLLVSLFVNALYWNTNASFFNHMMLITNFSVTMVSVVLFLSLVLILFYEDLSSSFEQHLAEIYTLIIFAAAGAVVMLTYSNLLMLFLGIEILSLSFYILTAIRKRNTASNEAAMKYFLMGSFSTGFLLFGIALIYGASSSFDLVQINLFASSAGIHAPVYFIAGVLLILSALLFKVAAAPFHFWTPDVYEGAPTLITALMSTVGKIASFGAFFILFNTCFAAQINNWESVIWVAALLSMSIGNIIAIYQTSIKRMLAYSSISHAGYMLLAILSLNTLSSNSILFYSIAYGLASMVAFVIVFIIRLQKHSDDVSMFKGLAMQNKWLAFFLAVAMLSLAGIPVTAGFFGKFYMFSATMQSAHYWLVVFAVVNSFMGVYYYLRPVVAAYFQKAEHHVKSGDFTPHAGELTVQIVPVPHLTHYLLLLLTLLTILIGMFPGLFAGII